MNSKHITQVDFIYMLISFHGNERFFAHFQMPDFIVIIIITDVFQTPKYYSFFPPTCCLIFAADVKLAPGNRKCGKIIAWIFFLKQQQKTAKFV